MDDPQNANSIIDKDGLNLSESVEVLSEIDNLKDIDMLVKIGQNLARDYRGDLQSFVRYSLLSE